MSMVGNTIIDSDTTTLPSASDSVYKNITASKENPTAKYVELILIYLALHSVDPTPTVADGDTHAVQ